MLKIYLHSDSLKAERHQSKPPELSRLQAMYTTYNWTITPKIAEILSEVNHLS